ncbi:MAG: hypothetical protein P4L87_21570, partial [Formivibrio sp.]|nr:hypothetical protein [Formivibrio sp.]
DQYQDSFTEKIMQLVERKAHQGKIENVETTDTGESARRSADVIDLTELLKRSLAGKAASTGKKAPGKHAKPAVKKPAKSSKAS